MTEPGTASSDLDTFLGTAPRAPWRRRILWLAIAIGIVSLALLALRFANGGQAANYISTPAELGDLPISLVVTGTLAPTSTSAAGTATAGVISEILVGKDDAVTKDQVLARLDPKPFQAALKTSQQSLAEAQQALSQAQGLEDDKQARLQLFSQVRRRSRGLTPSDREMLLAQADLSAAQDAVTAAATAVKLARTEVAQHTAALAASEIRAPADGIIAESTARIGQRVGAAAGALLFVIAAPYSQLDLDAPADPKIASRLPESARARVTVPDFPDQVFSGRVLDHAMLRTHGRRLLLRVSSAGDRLRPGMIATARLALGLHKDVLTVPNAALKFAQASDVRRGEADGSAVYILDSDGTPRRAPVTAIASDDTRTEIAPGALEPGMRVILGLR